MCAIGVATGVLADFTLHDNANETDSSKSKANVERGKVIMAVVEEVQINGVIIRIHDDCCLNTSDQKIQTILNRISSNALTALIEAQESKERAG